MRELFRLTIGPERQVTIPQKLLDNLAIAEGDELQIETDGGAIASVEAHKGYQPSSLSAEQEALFASRERELVAREREKIGDKMPDGSIYVGTSPETGKPMYATPADAPLTMKWKQAMEYAANLNAHGHQDWRAPTKGELNVLFQNRAAIGGFDESGSNPAGWYWSSSQNLYDSAWAQRFSDGSQNSLIKYHDSSLRCVR